MNSITVRRAESYANDAIPARPDGSERSDHLAIQVDVRTNWADDVDVVRGIERGGIKDIFAAVLLRRNSQRHRWRARALGTLHLADHVLSHSNGLIRGHHEVFVGAHDIQ